MYKICKILLFTLFFDSLCIYIAGEPGDGFIILLTVTPAVYPRLALKHKVPILPVELKENVTYLTPGKPKGPR